MVGLTIMEGSNDVLYSAEENGIIKVWDLVVIQKSLYHRILKHFFPKLEQKYNSKNKCGKR